MSLWDKWPAEIHERPTQIEKIKKAKAAMLTPVSVDRGAQKAEFSGKHGRYKTNLISCTCHSFSISGNAPCKHMYRLAMELGLMSGEYKTSKYEIVKPDKEKLSFSQAVEKLEALPDTVQLALHSVLYRIVGVHDPYAFIPDVTALEPLTSAGLLVLYSGADATLEVLKSLRPKSVLVRAMNQTGFEQASEAMRVAELHELFMSSGLLISELCPDRIPVTTTEGFSNARRKTYTYLKRKFESVEYYDPHSDSMKTLPYGYDTDINDTVNQMLIRYGHIRY